MAPTQFARPRQEEGGAALCCEMGPAALATASPLRPSLPKHNFAVIQAAQVLLALLALPCPAWSH